MGSWSRKSKEEEIKRDCDLKHSEVLKEIIMYFTRKRKTYQDNIEIQTTLEVYFLNEFVIKNHPISCMSRLTTITSILERIRQEEYKASLGCRAGTKIAWLWRKTLSKRKMEEQQAKPTFPQTDSQ